MLKQIAAREVRGIEIGDKSGNASVEPGGGRAGTNLAATGEDMVVELSGQAEFVGVLRAPFLDQGRKHLLGSGLAPELWQCIEQMILGKVAPGEFRVQAAEEQFPPNRCESTNPLDGVATVKVGKGIGPEPVLALLRPVGADAAMLRGGDLSMELSAVSSQNSSTLPMPGMSLRTMAGASDGLMIFALGFYGGVTHRPVGVATREFAGCLGGCFQANREFGFADADGAKADGGAYFRNEGGGQCRGLAQASGTPCQLQSTNHAPVGECVGPGVNEAAGHES